MKSAHAIKALSALAHDHRLAAFRLLIKEGPQGLPAGLIAEAMCLAPSSLSFHLSQLEHAGLVNSRRDQRRIIYSVDIATTRNLLAFLSEDCCGGRPEICAGLSSAASLCDEA